MSFIQRKELKSNFGIILGNRDVFPDHLVKEGRKDIIDVISELGYHYVILNEEDSPLGAVETYSDAKKCAELFKKNSDKILGIILCLCNFGDEKAVANTLKLSNLNVPVLIQASSDEIDKMDRKNRRDAFCGKISVTSVLYQYGIPFTLTKSHTCDIKSELFKEDLRRFDKICKIVWKLRNARLGQIGTRPTAFNTVRYSEKILEFNGISIEPIDLSEILGYINNLNGNEPKIKEKMDFIRNYISTAQIPNP
ncbi:hypothetical protein LCGC14_0999410, partial [marine sediment metagenome]